HIGRGQRHRKLLQVRQRSGGSHRYTSRYTSDQRITCARIPRAIMTMINSARNARSRDTLPSRNGGITRRRPFRGGSLTEKTTSNVIAAGLLGCHRREKRTTAPAIKRASNSR